MQVTITGASGFIGRRLVSQLEAAGHTIHVLGRSPRKGGSPSAHFSVWEPEKGPPPPAALAADAVIHLAGEPVSQRWSPEVKRRIRDSRVIGTQQLVAGLGQAEQRPKVLVTASAVGYYGDRGNEVLTESAGPGDTFLSRICVEWEAAANEARSLGMRVVPVRTGLVLGKGGGALEKMLPLFKAGVGGKLGAGTQWMPWVHLDDLVSLMVRAVEDGSWDGPVNGAAPNPVTNADFTAALGRAVHRPALLPVPEFAVKVLYGEMAQILFHSQRVIPQFPLSAGFEFRHPELFGALKAILA
ncbi:MAG: TIGR01777 family oxidoreductase [Bryobacterales bacterium]|nr:TIGR01777 family oxidoreductase [Bryobacterales bacterium]